MLLAKVPRIHSPIGVAFGALRLLVCLGLVLLAAALALAVAPRLLGYHMIAVNGGSMGESIPTGSFVAARWAHAEDVRVGDVVAISEETASRPKLHRVTWVQHDEGRVLVQTKGDANATPDAETYVLSDRVLTPSWTIPYVGYVTSVATTKLGWALLVGLPATFVCVLLLKAIWSGDKKRNATAASEG